MSFDIRNLGKALLVILPISCSAAMAATHDNKIEMNELFHDVGSSFCNPLEPDAKTPVELSFRCLQNDLSDVSVKYFDESEQQYHVLPMKRTVPSESSRFEYWKVQIPAGKSRKHYHFVLHDGTASAWYNAAGPLLSETEESDFMIVPGFHTPQWLKDGVMYQIFPDRFFDGDPANNVKNGQYNYAGKPTIARNWGDSPITHEGESVVLTFYGGDLKGIMDKLSYIRGTLGANIIYLNPIFESPSNHKYDTSDYDHVAACLGDDSSLSKLSAALHEPFNGTPGFLILDGVFNHTGDTHKWFEKYEYRRESKIKGAFESKESPYFNYYSFSKWPNKYATFLTESSLPKLNYGSPALCAAIYRGRNAVANRYLLSPFNIDGWRLDAPQYADRDGIQGSDPFNHEVWAEFRRCIKNTKGGAAILGENWQNASGWIAPGNQWDSVTNFDGFTNPVSEWITGQNYDGKAMTLNVSEFDRWLRLTRAHYPAAALFALSNHLGNHDISRFGERAHGESGKIRLALAFQMTYVGVPTLYYGDEYGMRGGKDPDDRRTFDWKQVESNNELISYTHKLIELRRKNSALRCGSFLSLDMNDKTNVYAFGRIDKSEKVAVVLNGAAQAQNDIPVSVYKLDMPDGSAFVDAISGTKYVCKEGHVSLNLEPWAAAILIPVSAKE